MTGRSERDLVRFGNRHRLQQFPHLPQPADFLNEAKEFIKAGEAANGLDRLGHRSNLLKGNGIPGLLFCRYGFGSGAASCLPLNW